MVKTKLSCLFYVVTSYSEMMQNVTICVRLGHSDLGSKMPLYQDWCTGPSYLAKDRSSMGQEDRHRRIGGGGGYSIHAYSLTAMCIGLPYLT